jgi:hypothetical protein
MAETKTKQTDASVEDFLNQVSSAQQRDDSFRILKIMKEITGLPPRMWGPSMVGFGEYHYKYDSGHEGDCFQIGFSPRKGKMSLYFFMSGPERFADQLKKLGKHKASKACLYINKLADVDEAVLRDMIATAFKEVRALAQQDKKRAQPPKKGRSKS